ncbi:MAG TPA: dephospho-CoA kinase [Chloroflexi bacterium]|nr:dephospho-CoA kinase [Chloroflexota bacterium]
MSQKYVIGLTGNIATGKSIVRRMLQELGASTVDADALVHLLQKPGSPVYKEIVEIFGSFILNDNATINRKRLSDIAFNIPEAMLALERITHPAVRRQLERAIERAPRYVVVIEAIKLLEGGLAEKCDAVWVVTSPEDVQMIRLVTKRKMSSQNALKRIQAQAPQQEKIARANVVIDNSGNLLKTWNAVQNKFTEIPSPAVAAPPVEEAPSKPVKEKLKAIDKSSIQIRRAARGDLKAMADLISAASQGGLSLDESDMMERLFSKGYLIALQGEELVGVVGWQTENLIAGIDDFFVKSSNLWPSVGKMLVEKVEEAVLELSCEAGLIFLYNKTSILGKKFLEKQGYQPQEIEDLEIKDWRQAAKEWQLENANLLVKQLMERRVMTPI